MLRGKTMLLGAFALVAAIAAGLLAQNWLSAQRAQFEAALAERTRSEPAEERPAVEVLVAAATLPTGTFLKPEHFDWVAFPDDAVPETYFVRADFEEDEFDTAFQGAVARTSLAAGEPVTLPKIVRPGDRGFLAAVLQPGMRAVSVPINATTGISGFVFPGDAVDLLLTVKITVGGGERRATETVLSGVRVLAVDQRTNDQEGEPTLAKTATLEVAPKEAEVIAVAMEMGRLSLALRSLASAEPPPPDALPMEDEAAMARLVALHAKQSEAAEKPSITWDDEATNFFTRNRPKAADGTPAPPPVEVRIVRRGEAETKTFAKTGADTADGGR